MAIGGDLAHISKMIDTSRHNSGVFGYLFSLTCRHCRSRDKLCCCEADLVAVEVLALGSLRIGPGIIGRGFGKTSKSTGEPVLRNRLAGISVRLRRLRINDALFHNLVPAVTDNLPFYHCTFMSDVSSLGGPELHCSEIGREGLLRTVRSALFICRISPNIVFGSDLQTLKAAAVLRSSSQLTVVCALAISKGR